MRNNFEHFKVLNKNAGEKEPAHKILIFNPFKTNGIFHKV